MLGLNTQRVPGKKEKGSPARNSKKGLKVVYISSPIKVTTSAAEFRATVQELTGRDSDVTRFMDCGDRYRPNRAGIEGSHQGGEDKARSGNPSVSSTNCASYYPNYLASWESESPTAESGSPFDEMGVQHRDADVYTSRMFKDSTLQEALGSFD